MSSPWRKHLLVHAEYCWLDYQEIDSNRLSYRTVCSPGELPQAGLSRPGRDEYNPLSLCGRGFEVGTMECPLRRNGNKIEPLIGGNSGIRLGFLGSYCPGEVRERFW